MNADRGLERPLEPGEIAWPSTKHQAPAKEHGA